MQTCGLRRVMQEVRDAVVGIMENTTLADLVAE
jgi:DNA-binding IscR family transcriptional regulator